jgi:hypothetical protein
MAQDRRARVAVRGAVPDQRAIFANLLPRYPEIKADLHLSTRLRRGDRGVLRRRLVARAWPRRRSIRRFTRPGSRWSARSASRRSSSSPAGDLAAVARRRVVHRGRVGRDHRRRAERARPAVQRNYGRSIINSFHAVWAAGAILGGLMGRGAIAMHMPRTTHLMIAGVRVQCGVVIAYPYLLRGPITTTIRRRARQAGRPRASRCTRRWSPLW